MTRSGGFDSGVYFFHIPKTAGMTVWKALEAAYPQHAICPHWLWDDLIEIPKEELNRYRVFRGHFYGFLERYLDREFKQFTLLRDPVERTISAYYYIRQLLEHPNHQQACELTLKEFCLHPATRHQVENYQAAYLATFVSGIDPARIARGFTKTERRNHLFQAALEPSVAGIPPADLLNAAELGLRRLQAVGTVESLGPSMLMIGSALGCTLELPEEPQNVTAERVSTSELDRETLAVINDITTVDRALYDRVVASCVALQVHPEPKTA